MSKIIDIINAPSFREPMFPEKGNSELEDLAIELLKKSSNLQGKIRPETAESLSKLVRSMNCYYSNLIEGHNTHPRDIDRALHHDYSKNPEKRALQHEAAFFNSL